jgi:hypothetical protein
MTNNAINSSIPIEVTKGGTQASSFVAYAPVVGGVTSTGALQSVASAGTTGQVLVSQGASALPIWAASSGFTNVVVQTFTSSGTYTPTAGMVKCIVEVLGGGAGGTNAVASNANQTSVGGGGGAGEYRKSIFDATTIGTSQVITIGNGGAQLTIGGDTTFGSLITSKGGKTSLVGSTSAAPYSNNAGGLVQNAGQGGNIVVTPGAPGFDAFGIFTSPNWLFVSGQGANTIYGAGGEGSTVSGNIPANYNGINAEGYGSGGGGGASLTGGGPATGGTGAPGLVIVTEFIA